MKELVMKRIALGISLLITLFLFAGCADMLSVNIFAEFDKPVAPSVEDIAKLETVDLLNVVSDLIESDTFYEDLEADEDTKNAFLTELAKVFLEEEAPVEQRQEAAILTADIVLNTTDAGDVVDGIVDVLNNLMAGGIPEGTDPEEFIEDLIEDIFGGIPSISALGLSSKDTTVQITEEQFRELVLALIDAAEAHRTFGDLLDPDNDGVLDIPSEFNIPEIAQDAIVTIIISDVIEQIGVDTEDGISKLYDVIFGDGGALIITENPLDDPALWNIIDAAGLGDLLNDLRPE
jgi:AcrR family transcriptional regulator